MPKITPGPFKVKLKEDQKYFWCACGLSATQPFCDGAHKGSGMKSVHYLSPRAQTVWLCGCRATKIPPFCDGSHTQERI